MGVRPFDRLPFDRHRLIETDWPTPVSPTDRLNAWPFHRLPIHLLAVWSTPDSPTSQMNDSRLDDWDNWPTARFNDRDISPSDHLDDFPFDRLTISPTETFDRLDISSTGRFIDWTFHRLDVSSTGHLTDWDESPRRLMVLSHAAVADHQRSLPITSK